MIELNKYINKLPGITVTERKIEIRAILGLLGIIFFIVILSFGISKFSPFRERIGARDGSWETFAPLIPGAGSESKIKSLIHPQTQELYVAYLYSDDSSAYIVRYSAGNWEILGGTSVTGPFNDLDFEFHPTSHEPYLLLQSDETIILTYYNGSIWQAVSTNKLGTGVGDIDLAFNPTTQEPYVAYQDDNHSGNATVKRFSGGSWLAVGSTGFSTGEARGVSLAFNEADNKPYIAYADLADSGKLHVMRFDTTIWNMVGNSATSSKDNVLNLTLAFQPQTFTPYVAYNYSPPLGPDPDQGNNVEMLVFNGAVWSTYFVPNDDESYSKIVMAFHPLTNYPHLAYTVNSEIYIKYYNGSDWATLGDTDSGSDGDLSLVFDSEDGEPTVAYSTVDGYGNLIKYIGLYQIRNLSAGLLPYNTSDQDITFGSNYGLVGENDVTIKTVNEDFQLLTVKGAWFINQDLDWSNLAAAVDMAQHSSYFNLTGELPGNQGQIILYVPANNYSDLGIHICPDATNISMVSDICTNGFTLFDGQTAQGITTNLITIEGNQAWSIAGFMQHGGAIGNINASHGDTFDLTYHWTRILAPGADALSQADAIEIAPNGSIYITGGFAGSNLDFADGSTTDLHTGVGGADIFISKYSENGDYAWTYTFGGSTSEFDTGKSIVIDSSNNLYFAGTFRTNSSESVDFDPGSGVDLHGGGGGHFIFISKYDAAGNYLWTRTIGKSTLNTYVLNALTLDDLGNVYLTGSYPGGSTDFDPSAAVDNHTSAGGDDIFITKLLANGDYQWTKSIGGAGSDIAYDIYHQDASLYLTGVFSDTVDFDASTGVANLIANGGGDVFVANYQTDGTYGFALSFGSSDTEIGKAIITDDCCNIYVGGIYRGTTDFDFTAGVDNKVSNGESDVFLVSMSQDGSIYNWSRTFGFAQTEPGADDDLQGLAINSTFDQLFISGSLNGNGIVDFDDGAGVADHIINGQADTFVTSFDIDSSYIWTIVTGGSSSDVATDLTYSVEGDMLFAGRTNSSNIDFDQTPGIDLHYPNPTNQNAIYVVKYGEAAAPSPTPTPTSSATPTPTFSITPTASVTPSATPSLTPTATFTPTVTPSSTPTPTLTNTPTPSPTRTPTPTFLPTATVSVPTLTPTSTTGILLSPTPTVMIGISPTPSIINNTTIPTPTLIAPTSTIAPTIVRGEFQIINLNANLLATDSNGNDIGFGSNFGLVGINDVIVKNRSDGKYIARFPAVNFTKNLDWGGLEAATGTDAQVNKTYAYLFRPLEGAQNSFSLFVLQNSADNYIVYCPNAHAFAELNSYCSGAQSFTLQTIADSKILKLINIANANLWELSGVTGSGIVSLANSINPTVFPTINELPQTGEDSDIWQSLNKFLRDFASNLSNEGKALFTGLAALPATGAGLLSLLSYPKFLTYGFAWIQNRKSKKVWGIVYDKQSKEPLAFASLKLFQNGKFVQEQISNLDGKYGFVVDKGIFNLVCEHPAYIRFDKQIEIKEAEGIVALDLPMVILSAGAESSASLFSRWQQYLRENLHHINTILVIIGFMSSLLAAIFTRSLINYLLIAFYIMQFGIIIVLNMLEEQPWGFVYDSESAQRIKGVLVRVYDKIQNRQLDVKMTDDGGRYGFDLDPGKYLLTAEAPGYIFPSSQQKKENIVITNTGTNFLSVELKGEQRINVAIALDKKVGEAAAPINMKIVSPFGANDQRP